MDSALDPPAGQEESRGHLGAGKVVAVGTAGWGDSGASWEQRARCGWCPVCSVWPAGTEHQVPRGLETLALRRLRPQAGRATTGHLQPGTLGPSDWRFYPRGHGACLFSSLVDFPVQEVL